MHRTYRQGDVWLQEIEDLPLGLKPVKRRVGSIVVQEGELTGHHHAIAEREAEMLTSDAADLFLRVTAPVRLTHQEHAAIELPPGTYRVGRQREYVPKAIPRYVAD